MGGFLRENPYPPSRVRVQNPARYGRADLENLCYTAPVATIRASDIGNYLYCRRAWWYRRQGVESEDRAELAAGTDLHQHHGRQVLASSLTRTLGLILLLAALVMLVAYCTARIL